MCTAALTITDSKLMVKIGSSSVMKLPVFKYINSLRELVLSCSIFESSVMHTCDRDCAGRACIAGVLCSQCNYFVQRSRMDVTARGYRKALDV